MTACDICLDTSEAFSTPIPHTRGLNAINIVYLLLYRVVTNTNQSFVLNQCWRSRSTVVSQIKRIVSWNKIVF
jgi:hypothetical protein